jgi:sugar lactone lactonase YvrE
MINRFMKISGITTRAAAVLTFCMAVGVAHASTVPAVIAQSTAKIVPGTTGTVPANPTTFVNPTSVAVDPSGNIWVADTSGRVWEVPVGTTTPVQLYPTVPANSTIGLGGNNAIAIDAAGDIIVGGSYSTNGVLLFKNNSGVVSPVPTYIGSNSNLGGVDGYYASWRGVAVVNGTQVYAGVSYANAAASTAIFTFTTGGSGGAKFLASLPGGNPANSMAGDNQSHLYYSDGVGVYAVSTATAGAVPVQLTLPAVKTPGGVSTDAQGNLYVTDSSSNNRIIKVPNEGGTLNPADAYEVVANVYDAYAVGIDATGNLYYTDDYTTNSLFRATEGGTPFATTATGVASASVTTNFIFNTATTPTAIGYYQGTGAATEFVSAGGTCAAGTPYTAFSYCTVTATFKPTQAGVRTGSVELLASGKAIGTAYLFGIGSGAAITVDPGTQSTLTVATSSAASYKSPSAVAFDAVGNLYVADASLNTVFVTPTGATAATLQIGNGLSQPGGVTVDGAGNVFIADTGNNRIVEVPNEAGTLNSTDQLSVTTTPVAVTGYTITGSASPYTVTFTTAAFTATSSFTVGQTVAVAGLSTASGKLLDTTFVVTAVSATGFSANTTVAPIAQTADNGLAAVGAVLKSPGSIRASRDGSLYVVDAGNTRVLRLATYAGLTAVISTALGSGVTAPAGVTTDFLGNVYVSDAGSVSGSGTIQSFNPSSNTPTLLLSQLSNPQALAVDAAGDVYYVSGGNKTVQLVPDIAGVLTPASKISLGTGLVTPTGLAVDAAGNVVIADGGASTAYKLARTAASINFGNVNIQLTSTPQVATVTSAGNLPLTLGTPYAVVTGSAASFQPQSPSNACASAGTFSPGTGCVISVVFAPVAINAQSETYTLATNAANSAAPTALFSGFATNLSLTSTTLTMTPATAPSFGQTVTVTATIAAARSGYTPTGTVTFNLDGTTAGTATIVNGTAANTATFVFSIAAGNPLSAGPHTITASYGGDTLNASSRSTNTLSFTVAQSTAGVQLTVMPATAVSPGSTLYFSVLVTPGVAYTAHGSVQLDAVSGTSLVPLSASTALIASVSGTTSYAQIPIVTSATTGTGLLSAGQYQIVAVYTGDANYSSSTSPGVNVSVQTPGYTVATTNNHLTVKQGSSVSTTITITTHAGYGGDTYTPASGLTAASSSFSLIDYTCSTLPAYAKCAFSPGFAEVNSYNVNDPCVAFIANNTSGASAGTACLYNPYTESCTAVAAGTTNAVSYCSDPNYSNTYTMTLTVQTDVIPASSGGIGGGVLGLFCAAMLLWMLRRRRLAGSLLMLVAMLGLSLGAIGCGSGVSTTDISPAGASSFTITFQGQTGTSNAAPFVVQTLPMTLTITN